MALKQTIGFLGAGRMATALAGGMVKAKLITPRALFAADVVAAAAKAFAKATGGKALKKNSDVLQKAMVIVIAVKPHQVEELLGSLVDDVPPKHLFISIATGVTIVTAMSADGRPYGITCNSFASVSLNPPLVLWSLGMFSQGLPIFQNASHFTVNVLDASQQPP